MTERVPCRECGAAILPSTAEKNGGLCMPCKGGYRKDMEASKEASKLYYAQEKKYRESAEWKHWIWLVEQVHRSETGFFGLSHPNKLYFASNLVDREVYNGGFDQYFYNSSGDYFDFAVEGLRTIGALESLRLLLAAKEILFGDAAVPVDTGDRRIFLAAVDSETKSNRDQALDALDQAFYKDPDKFADRMSEFAKKHDLQKNF